MAPPARALDVKVKMCNMAPELQAMAVETALEALAHAKVEKDIGESAFSGRRRRVLRSRWRGLTVCCALLRSVSVSRLHASGTALCVCLPRSDEHQA
jgi:hypothetical protein